MQTPMTVRFVSFELHVVYDACEHTPYETKLSGSPKTSNAVSDQESDEGSTNGTQLNHGGDVGEEVGLFSFAESIILQTE